MVNQSLALRRLELLGDRERLKAWMQGRSATAPEMATALGLTVQAIHALLRTLRAQGAIDKFDETRWALTGTGPVPRRSRRTHDHVSSSDGKPRVLTVQARQLGLERDPWTAALFGPRASDPSESPAP